MGLRNKHIFPQKIYSLNDNIEGFEFSFLVFERKVNINKNQTIQVYIKDSKYFLISCLFFTCQWRKNNLLDRFNILLPKKSKPEATQ